MTLAAAVGQAPIRVLLVEDDEDDYLLTRDALRAIGPGRMVLEWVDTPERALAALEAGAAEVCLLDYRLGACTGLELLGEARRRGWQGPVILLTGQDDEEVDRRAMEAGVTEFLEKSQLTPTLLERSIRYALQHARTLEALRRSQASFRELIERLPDGIGVLQEERLVYASPQLVKLLGCASADELLGRTEAELWEAFTPLEDRSTPPGPVRAAMRAGGTVPPTEVRLRRRDGSLLPVEMAQVPSVFDGRASLVRIVRDLTERMQLQARLRLADRMASLGTMAAGIAHEINNPLAFTLANLEHLETGLVPRLELPPAEREEAERTLADARLGAARVRDIVRQLRMFSRLEEEARPEPVDMHRVIETSIGMAWNEIRHRARLVRDYGEPLTVEANEGRLGQVLLNLLVNAAQAIPEGSVERQEIRVVTRARAGLAVVEVRDTGVGMGPERLEHIFEPFYTSKPAGMGTGLGLSICHGIVTGYGGRMEVESEPGRGSTFRLLLPAAEAPCAAKPAPEPTRPAAARRGRVLVVDDEAQVGTAIRRALHREHDVVALTSPLEARRRLLGGERFDVVLCDLMMPELSGMELYQSIASGSPELAGRVVFLTGGAFTPQMHAFLAAMDNPRIDKPFTLQELRDVVRACLG